MPYIDISLCPLCLGTLTVAEPSSDPSIAAKLRPCDCVSGVEAITELGEVLAIGKDNHEN